MGKDIVKVWSQRLTETTISQLEEIKDNQGFETYSIMLETMIERFYNPVKINRENEKIINDLNEKIQKLENTNSELLKEKENQCIPIVDNSSLLEALSEIEDLKVEVENSNMIIENLNEKLMNSVFVGPFNMKVLEKVAERESEKRGKGWNKSQIVNCMLDFRFVKGKLNAGFDSLPDSVINEIKKEV